MHLGYPVSLLKTWANTQFSSTAHRAVLRKLHPLNENNPIEDEMQGWFISQTPEERILANEILSKWQSIDIDHPGFVQNFVPSKKTALASGYYHPEGSPTEDSQVQQLIAEGEAILKTEESQNRDAARQTAYKEILDKILKYADTHSEEDLAIELASDCLWRRVALLKSSNMPQSLLDTLTDVIKKRKKALRLQDAAKKIGVSPSDLQRWANAGKIKTLGYRLVSHGMITLVDRANLPTRKQVKTLEKEEAHLPESERAFGYWAQCTLLKRGWKKPEIAKYLGEPDVEAKNPHRKSGPPMRLFLKARVLRVEEEGLVPAKPKDDIR